MDEAPTAMGVFEDLSINSSLFTGLPTLLCSSRNTPGAGIQLGANPIQCADECVDIDLKDFLEKKGKLPLTYLMN